MDKVSKNILTLYYFLQTQYSLTLILNFKPKHKDGAANLSVMTEENN
jgi:hypothetical protein